MAVNFRDVRMEQLKTHLRITASNEDDKLTAVLDFAKEHISGLTVDPPTDSDKEAVYRRAINQAILRLSAWVYGVHGDEFLNRETRPIGPMMTQSGAAQILGMWRKPRRAGAI